MGPNHPWRHRLERSFNRSFSQDDFTKKWLLDLGDADLSKPSIAVINGWGAQHEENRWWAEALSNGIASMFAYDSRGQGSSIKDGDLDAIQNAIDADRLIGAAFADLDHRAALDGVQPGNKILEGHCVGAMTVAAAFAGKFPVARQTDGVILISPVSEFNLPFLAKASYFTTEWFGHWVIHNLGPKLAKHFVSGEESEDSRRKAIERMQRYDIKAGIRQVRQIFWKENVSKLWGTIDKPVLILVSPNDPVTPRDDSAKVFDLLRYPIWMELEVPDHMLLEDNVEFLSEFIPRFTRDPWGVYEENKHLRP